MSETCATDKCATDDKSNYNLCNWKAPPCHTTHLYHTCSQCSSGTVDTWTRWSCIPYTPADVRKAPAEPVLLSADTLCKGFLPPRTRRRQMSLVLTVQGISLNLWKIRCLWVHRRRYPLLKAPIQCLALSMIDRLWCHHYTVNYVWQEPSMRYCHQTQDRPMVKPMSLCSHSNWVFCHTVVKMSKLLSNRL